MRSTVNPLSAALGMLHARGFAALPRRGLTRRFEGPLHCQAGDVSVELTVSDWDFVAYPEIRITRAPAALPSLTPHLDADDCLCYLASGSVVLDRYHPEHALAQCLDLAQKELDRLMVNRSYRQDEFQSEFGASWHIGQRPLPWSVLLGTVGPAVTQASALVIGDEQDRRLAITSDEAEIRDWCAVRGWPEPVAAAMTCWIVRSNRHPTLPVQLPKTVGEMLEWIRLWDPSAYNTCQGVLGCRDYLAQSTVAFIVSSPAGWFGFSLRLDDVKRKAFRKNPKWMRQSLHGRGSVRAIARMSVHQIGPDFVHSRNLTYSSLGAKKITLIGCGAIGGYLAQALVRLGAGTQGGQLTLIDPDILRAENLGRHLLGYDSLYLAKADAVVATLRRQFPHAALSAAVRAAHLPADLVGDLVIDATGEEAVSEALNHHRLRLPAGSRVPILHAWIVGNGDYSQALWTDSQSHACYRCLRQNDSLRTPRFTTLVSPVATLNLGCHAHTPYAVSAPLAAAALAADMVVGWLQGSVSPRFRTRQLETSRGQQVKSQDLPPLSGCPACARG